VRQEGLDAQMGNGLCVRGPTANRKDDHRPRHALRLRSHR